MTRKQNPLLLKQKKAFLGVSKSLSAVSSRQKKTTRAKHLSARAVAVRAIRGRLGFEVSPVEYATVIVGTQRIALFVNQSRPLDWRENEIVESGAKLLVGYEALTEWLEQD